MRWYVSATRFFVRAKWLEPAGGGGEEADPNGSRVDLKIILLAK
jgi:hypothetical protein